MLWGGAKVGGDSGESVVLARQVWEKVRQAYRSIHTNIIGNRPIAGETASLIRRFLGSIRASLRIAPVLRGSGRASQAALLQSDFPAGTAYPQAIGSNSRVPALRIFP